MSKGPLASLSHGLWISLQQTPKSGPDTLLATRNKSGAGRPFDDVKLPFCSQFAAKPCRVPGTPDACVDLACFIALEDSGTSKCILQRARLKRPTGPVHGRHMLNRSNSNNTLTRRGKAFTSKEIKRTDERYHWHPR